MKERNHEAERMFNCTLELNASLMNEDFIYSRDFHRIHGSRLLVYGYDDSDETVQNIIDLWRSEQKFMNVKPAAIYVIGLDEPEEKTIQYRIQNQNTNEWVKSVVFENDGIRNRMGIDYTPNKSEAMAINHVAYEPNHQRLLELVNYYSEHIHIIDSEYN